MWEKGIWNGQVLWHFCLILTTFGRARLIWLNLRKDPFDYSHIWTRINLALGEKTCPICQILGTNFLRECPHHNLCYLSFLYFPYFLGVSPKLVWTFSQGKNLWLKEGGWVCINVRHPSSNRLSFAEQISNWSSSPSWIRSIWHGFHFLLDTQFQKSSKVKVWIF